MNKIRLKKIILTTFISLTLAISFTLSVFAQNMPDNIVKDENVRSSNYMKLWYDEPGESWRKTFLPLGNGNIGAMSGGKTDVENIRLNEITLWAGGPNSSNNFTGGNTPGAYTHLDQIRKDVMAGKKPNVHPLEGNRRGWEGYQVIGDLMLNFLGNSKVTQPENYRRELDLNTAVETISYSKDGVEYKREYFVSNPGNVMVLHLTTSKKDALSMNVSLAPDYSWDHYNKNSRACDLSVKDHVISCNGLIYSSKMRFATQIAVVAKNADVTDETNNSVNITNGEDVTIIMSAGTNYDITESKKLNSYKDFQGADRVDFIDDKDPDGKIAMSKVAERVKSACNKKYEDLKKAHVDDYSSIFGRMELNLGGAEYADYTSDELVKKCYWNDIGRRYYEALMFQYGRYLLLASSRDAVLPAHLQGIWGEDNDEPWGCDYHLNVNIQMNYWPAFVTNMAETADPLVSYLDYLRGPGKITAKEHFGVDNPEAWVATTVTTPMGFTGVGWEFYWGWTPGSAAWICDNIWDYYLYTEDREILNKVYPIIKGAATFWKEFLIDDGTGKLISSPGTSSEHGPVSAGTTYDTAFAKMIIGYAIEGGKLYGEDPAVLKEFQNYYDKIHPYEIGASGQIKEWREEVEYNTDANGNPIGQPHHRHFSHLLGLHPGRLINKETPELLEAAVKTLEYRGDGSGVGWSGTQSACMWSRTGNGNIAYNALNYMLKWSIGPNLLNQFDQINLFQIDGNFGVTSCMSEMLLQSQAGYIDVLPALPDEWATGSYKGMVARGNFETDVAWENKNIKEIKITSRNGNKCKVKGLNVGNGVVKSNNKPVSFTKIDDNTIEFETVKDGVYVINNIPVKISDPKDIIVSRLDKNSINVSWNKVEGATAYNVYRVSKGGVVRAEFKNITATEIVDNTAKYNPEDKCNYKVEAIGADGETGILSSSVNESDNPSFIDSTSSKIHYNGNWKVDYDDNACKNSVYTSSESGAFAETYFVGTGIEYYPKFGADFDSVDVYIDGIKKETVNINRKINQYGLVGYKIDNLDYGRHKIKLQVPDKKLNDNVAVQKVSVDYFYVLNSSEHNIGMLEVALIGDKTILDRENSSMTLKVKHNGKEVPQGNYSMRLVDDIGWATNLASIDKNGRLKLANSSSGFVTVMVNLGADRVFKYIYVDGTRRSDDGTVVENVLRARPVTLIEGGYLNETYSTKHLTDGYACLDNNYNEAARFASPSGQNHFIAEIPLAQKSKIYEFVIYERWAKDGSKLWDDLYISYVEVSAFVDGKWVIIGKSVGQAEKYNGRTAIRTIKCTPVVSDKIRVLVSTEKAFGASIWEFECYASKNI